MIYQNNLFRKDKNGKYINYPYIQPYLTLSDSSNINKDDVFYDKSKRVNPRNNKEEPIYIIEE